MEKRPYKLAIMGASGVGKTVFLGSYFYANERGMGKKYHIAPLNEKLTAAPGQTEPPDERELNSVQVVNELIDILFKGTQIGTHKRVDMSMTVGDRMKVRLFDLPGGFTVDSTRWEDQKIREDLEMADGVIFFIPAWDTLHNYAECRKTSTPFDTAISQYIRNEKAGAKEKKADIPIYFLFTKADKLQGADKDVTAEQLLDLWSGLKSASQTGSQRSFFKKGQFDKTFLVTSLGTWLDDRTPPKEEEYQPINVVESMESLFDDMARARRLRDRNSLLKKASIFAAAALGIFALAAGTLYSVQKSRWNGAERAAQLAAARQNYPEAIKALDDFRAHGAPLGLPLPSFMSPGKDAGAQIEKLRRDYEADSYKGLAGYLQIADAAELPDSRSDSFKQGSQAVKDYLTNDAFAAMAPEHYAAVKKAERYYAAGAMMGGTVKTLDDIEGILRQIDLVPDWREPLLNRIPAGAAAWIAAVDQDAAAKEAEASGSGLQEYDRAASQLRALMSSPHMNDQLREALNAQLGALEKSRSSQADKLISAKIAAAGSMENPEEALRGLEELKASVTLSEAQIKRLQDAADRQYEALVDRWLSDKTAAETLRGYLRQYPDMPRSAKSRVDSYLQRMGYIRSEDLRQSILFADYMSTLMEKAKEVNELHTASAQELHGAVAQRFQELLSGNADFAGKKIADSLAKNDFSKAKEHIEGFSAQKKRDLANFSRSCDTSAAENSVAGWEEGWTSKVLTENYRFLRDRFREYKDTCEPSDLDSFSKDLKAFTDRWPGAPQKDEVQQVIDYISAIAKGADARLTVVKAKLESGRNWTFGSDLQLNLKVGGKTYPTDFHRFRNEPEYNETFNIRWSAGTESCDIDLINKGTLSKNDELLMTITVPCGGIAGWRKLDGSHTQSYATVWLKVEGIPDCPW
ncbi:MULTISPECIES: GTPase domain-containing protein [unclassified Pyramidobacter]|uniref:GTPase domain-containing protein n=1 Tax=unclassified Pyramidobacter TaxID=2632171 RepID=UPI000EA10192|nr:GTPase domain-containing protein [Pyramidobacter sp. CG50-2]RKJ79366.1 hypothetical protein D7D26_05070 [Pyramidobacter sp. CG50-2]